MGRAHALAISVLLTIAAVGGAYATTKTLHIGESSSESTIASDSLIAKRKSKLDRWQRSLRQTAAKKPPKLPGVPKYPRVAIPTAGPAPVARTVAALPAPQAARRAAPPKKVVYRRPKPVVVTRPAQPRERSEEEAKARIAPLKAEIKRLEAQIEALKEQREQIKKQLEPLKEQAEHLEGEEKRRFIAQYIDPLEAQIDSLKAQELQIRARISELHEQIEQIHG